MRATRPLAVVTAALLATGSLLLPASLHAADPDVTAPETFLRQTPTWVPVSHLTVQFDSSDPTATFECRLDEGIWSGCTSPYELTDLVEGEHTIHVRATDPAGNVEPTPEEQTFWVDLSGPVGTVTINRGATTVHRGLVDLTLPATDLAPVDRVTVSTSPDLDDQGRLVGGYEWTAYWASETKDLAFDLSGGSQAIGPRTVYAQWSDIHGHHGPVASDTVQFDPTTRTSTTVHVDVTQRMVNQGGVFAFEAEVTADDGAPVRDGMIHVEGIDFGGNSSGTHNLAVNGAWGASATIPAGRYALKVTFDSSDELASSSTTVPITVGPPNDPVPPGTTLGAYPPLSERPTSVTLSIGSTPDATRFECRLDESAWAPCSADRLLSVAPGPHVAEARAVDMVGLVDPSPAKGIWSAAPDDSWRGSISWDPPQFGLDHNFTTTPTVGLVLQPPSDDATAVRISNSAAWDGAILTQAKEMAWPVAGSVAWDLRDPTYGGTAGDGTKIVWAQWRSASGTWTIPAERWVELDRTPPALSMIADGGSTWVRSDQILVVLRPVDATGIVDRYRIAGSAAELATSDWEFRQGDFIAFPLANAQEGNEGLRTVFAQVRDQAGNVSAVVSATVVLDRADPVASLATPGFVTGSQASTSSVRVRVTGSAADKGSGVASTRLVEDGPTSGPKTIATRTTSAIVTDRVIPSSKGTAYRFLATDRSGRAKWTTSPTWTPIIRDDHSTTITYAGTWRRWSASGSIGSRYMHTTQVGATARFTFKGRSVAIVAPKSRIRGRIKVYVDGVYQRTVDLYRSSSLSRVVVYSRTFPTTGTHTVTVTVVNTPGRNRVDLDAFVYLP